MAIKGIHKFSKLKIVLTEASVSSSIFSWKLRIRKMEMMIEVPTMKKVSQRKMLKMFPFSAPTHLCTPMALALCEMDEMEMSA